MKAVAYLSERKTVRKKLSNTFFKIFCSLWPPEKNLEVIWLFFGWVVKTKFYVSTGILTEQCFWGKLLIVSGFSEEQWSFRESDEKFFQGCQNWKKFPEETGEENRFSKKKNLLTFQDFERTLFSLWRKILPGLLIV